MTRPFTEMSLDEKLAAIVEASEPLAEKMARRRELLTRASDARLNAWMAYDVAHGLYSEPLYVEADRRHLGQIAYDGALSESKSRPPPP